MIFDPAHRIETAPDEFTRLGDLPLDDFTGVQHMIGLIDKQHDEIGRLARRLEGRVAPSSIVDALGPHYGQSSSHYQLADVVDRLQQLDA